MLFAKTGALYATFIAPVTVGTAKLISSLMVGTVPASQFAPSFQSLKGSSPFVTSVGSGVGTPSPVASAPSPCHVKVVAVDESANSPATTANAAKLSLT